MAAVKRIVDRETVTIEFVEELKRQWIETIDALPDPFMMVSDSYRITRANSAMAEIAETDVKSIVGQSCFKVFAGRKTPCENCKMKSSKSNQSIPGYEIYNEANERWYEVATRRLNSNAHQEGVVQIYRDRTDAKRLQNQLAQQEKLASIGQLAGGFAHEINNPLGGILVFSQMLLRELDQKSPHYQDVVEIETAAKRCKIIVENLLDYSRQRPIKPKIEACDIHAIIAQSVKFSALGHNKNDRCDTDLCLDAPHSVLQSDQNRLTQIFMNLCTNAFQAMPDGGTLTVTTRNETIRGIDFLTALIQDNGTGIKASHLAKIFEPFFTTKEPGQGTGLGLSIVHGIVQDLGGTIEATSRIGKGTTFTVRIPMILNPTEVQLKS